MTEDPLDTLTTMRPRVGLDDVWTPAQQHAALERVLSDRSVARPRRGRRPVAVIASLTTALALAPGVATAVGGGMTPQSFAGAYAGFLIWQEGGADPAASERIGSTPGPFGGVFSVLTTTGAEGDTCVAPVFETAASAQSPLPDDFEQLYHWCEASPPEAAFAEIGGQEIVPPGLVVYDYTAGDAVSGELRLPTGQTYPVVLAQGRLFGWFPLAATAEETDAVLTGFAADGSVVGTTAVL